MTPERLREILSAYGAEPSRWPTAERAAALALLADDEPAAGLARAQAALDDVLDAYRVPRPDAALVGRALAGFTEAQVTPLRKWWLYALLAGAGALGMATGALTLSLLSPAMLDRGPAAWIDDQPTIFSPLDIEEAVL